MDRYSHIALAKKMLDVVGEDRNMAYLSIIPKIDGKPDYLHRLHCHPLIKAPELLKASLWVFGSRNNMLPKIDLSGFEYTRLLEDKNNFIDDYFKTGGSDVENMKVKNGFGALMTIMSHTYFDTFNNTVQAFAPYDVHCAGQYDMWKEVDYFEYRIKWYEETAPLVRENVCNEEFWNTKFKSEELVKGLIQRISFHTQPSPNILAVKKIEEALGVENVEYTDRIEQFFVDLESSLKYHLVNSVKEEGM